MKKILLSLLFISSVFSGECIVSIDIGHTREKGGSTSAHGVPEYKFNYIVAKKLNYLLRHTYGIKTYIINPTGDDISLQDRLLEGEENNSHLFVSIHHDSVKEKFLKSWMVKNRACKYCDTFSGYSLFVSPKNRKFKKSLSASVFIGENLRKQGFTPTLYHKLDIKGERKKMYDEKYGVYQYDNLVVLKGSIPSVLIEGGMIVNRDEELDITDPDRQERFLTGVANGISSWCKKEKHDSSFTLSRRIHDIAVPHNASTFHAEKKPIHILSSSQPQKRIPFDIEDEIKMNKQKLNKIKLSSGQYQLKELDFLDLVE